jgi:hypothetical protein
MAITEKNHTGDGSRVLFSFTFEYLKITDIKVSLDGVDTIEYTLANATEIRFNTAPADGVAVRIYRQTDDEALVAQFFPGSAIRAQDLNENFTQNLYVAQEVNNNALTTDGSNPMVGDLDMGGYKVTNLAAPVAGTDAATKTYVDDIAISGLPNVIPSANVVVTQVGTGAVQRTVESKLQDTVSIKDFGAVGDGVTNDRAAIQAALDTGKSVYVPQGTYAIGSTISLTADGQCLYGDGNLSVIKTTATTARIDINNKDGTAIRNLKIDAFAANTNPGIYVSGGSSGIDIENVYFYGGNQRVYLGACDHIRVDSCTFDNTGYGVIQQSGYASSFGIVTNCIARDVKTDFVELNCNLNDSGVPNPPTARNWIISNNQFSGSKDYPTPGTEDRFVGITEVENVTITGNVVERSQGDAPVHLEDLRGETIVSNNIFTNCVPSGGNTGMIYILNSAENVIVDGNIFGVTDPALNGTTIRAYASDSQTYSNKVIFSNNRVFATNGNTLKGVTVSFQNTSSLTLITDNVFDGCDTVLDAVNANNLSFSGNKLINCTELLNFNNPSSTGGSKNNITNNTTKGTTATHDIYYNAGASLRGLTDWKVSGNQFCKDVYFSGSGSPGGLGTLTNLVVTDNQFTDGAKLTIVGTLSNCFSAGNQYTHPATSSIKMPDQASFGFLRDFLNVRGMQIASRTVTGSFSIDIDGIVGADATWKPLSVLLIYSGVSPSSANATKNIAWITTRMITSSNTTAAGVNVTDIVGTSTISVTSTSSSHMKISVTAAAEDASQRIAVFMIGATTDVPYQSDLTTFSFTQI